MDPNRTPLTPAEKADRALVQAAWLRAYRKEGAELAGSDADWAFWLSLIAEGRRHD